MNIKNVQALTDYSAGVFNYLVVNGFALNQGRLAEQRIHGARSNLLYLIPVVLGKFAGNQSVDRVFI
ncbi:hypothetical protein [Methylocaldum sp.]|uniref:hypothetical protein n=1 Tax=Methylocaldum sp. TaxID=1969727 RepID=UPI002D71B8E6|nr:hypothetical protein [Methylocaldum sp.]HYE34424.1 hypothetical protein [Methylocaldum sp.]